MLKVSTVVSGGVWQAESGPARKEDKVDADK